MIDDHKEWLSKGIEEGYLKISEEKGFCGQCKTLSNIIDINSHEFVCSEKCRETYWDSYFRNLI